MQFSTLNILSMAALAAAFPSRAGPSLTAERSTCEAPTKVQFYYNDTSIGTLYSCSAAAGLLPRAVCVDGPVTKYTVVAGDTLQAIAALFSSAVCNIAKANSIANPNYIVAGQVLNVPTDLCTSDLDPNTCWAVPGTATCVAPGAGVSNKHTIVKGDTFFILASNLGITLQSLVAANPGVNASDLQIGQVINIPVCSTK